MSPDLGVSESLIGQLITVYALGTLLTAMALTAALQGWRRRKVLLIAVGGFAIVNTITALSDNYGVTLVARFGAGIFAGQVWALAAGYAARMVPEKLKGRAIAVAWSAVPSRCRSACLPPLTWATSSAGGWPSASSASSP